VPGRVWIWEQSPEGQSQVDLNTPGVRSREAEPAGESQVPGREEEKLLS